MTDLDDLPLRRPEEEETLPGRGPRWVWLALAVVVALASLVAYFTLRVKRTAPAADAAPAGAPTISGSAAPAPPAPEDASLPPLDESDTLFRELARRLSSHPRLAEWLASRGLIRTVTVVVSNVAEGVSPAKHLSVFKPQQPFRVLTRGRNLYLDPRSYERYDVFADVFASQDARGSAQAYRRLTPLFAEAYRELGHPDGNFDAALERAIQRMLATPVLGGEVLLIQKAVSYEYADPRLESLSAAQKHLLRMGPRNLPLVQRKLREVAAELGMTADRLAPER